MTPRPPRACSFCALSSVSARGVLECHLEPAARRVRPDADCAAYVPIAQRWPADAPPPAPAAAIVALVVVGLLGAILAALAVTR